MTLEAEVKREKEASPDQRVLHSERVYGKIVRSFTLPQEVVPKKTAAQRKQISIQ